MRPPVLVMLAALGSVAMHQPGAAGSERETFQSSEA